MGRVADQIKAATQDERSRALCNGVTGCYAIEGPVQAVKLSSIQHTVHAFKPAGRSV